MIHQIVPSHVALLVTSVSKAAEYLRRFDFQIGPEEVWDGEGTKEIYVEKDKANSLLLMEPIKAEHISARWKSAVPASIMSRLMYSTLTLIFRL